MTRTDLAIKTGDVISDGMNVYVYLGRYSGQPESNTLEYPDQGFLYLYFCSADVYGDREFRNQYELYPDNLAHDVMDRIEECDGRHIDRNAIYSEHPIAFPYRFASISEMYLGTCTQKRIFGITLIEPNEFEPEDETLSFITTAPITKNVTDQIESINRTDMHKEIPSRPIHRFFLDIYSSDPDESEDAVFHKEAGIDTTDTVCDRWLEDCWDEINALETEFGKMHLNGSPDNAETGFYAYDIEEKDAETVFDRLYNCFKNYAENEGNTKHDI